jgi:hypothetical protein
MELPEDIVRWVSLNFNEIEREQALSRLREAVLHDGKPAGVRLLRCAAVASNGDLKGLDEYIDMLLIDWRDVIVAGEYDSQDGKLVKVRDLNNPID